MKFKKIIVKQKYKIVRSIDELKELSHREREFVLFLKHGLVSRKTIKYNPGTKRPFSIFNHIDDSRMRLSETELMNESITHVGTAIAKHSLAVVLL
jgi:hypothetical protein